MEIHYKGFIGKVIFSSEVDSFYGEILNNEDVIVFQATCPQAAKEAMKTAIDCYLGYLSDVKCPVD